MKLPNGDRAIVEEAKLRDYCLSQTHPRGRHKARLFAAALGISVAHVDLLRSALLRTARDDEATPTRGTPYGQIYEIRCTLTGPGGTAEILSVWIVPTTDPTPRLVTCYPS